MNELVECYTRIWIPVTEYLPKEFHYVIVTTREHEVTLMYMTSGGYWSDGMIKLEPPGYVIAWMELPDEYKPCCSYTKF